MPQFKVQGKHHMTGKSESRIYEAEDASRAEKKGWDEGLIVEKATLIEEDPACQTYADSGKVKKCPYCAEEIQAEAIKCKHCGEWLNASKPARSEDEKIPWYFRTSFIVIALCCVGPLALPLIWWRPQTSRTWKIILTIVILAASWFLYLVAMDSIRHLKEYYQLIDKMTRQTG